MIEVVQDFAVSAFDFKKGAIVSWVEEGFQYFGLVDDPIVDRRVVLPDGKFIDGTEENPALVIQRAVLEDGTKLRPILGTSTARLSADCAPVSTKLAIVIEKEVKARAFDGSVQLDTQTKAAAIERDGIVVDYRDVEVSGYLATWGTPTERDRQGDYIIPGAFKDTLPDFMTNPVCLMDHRNSVTMVCGSYVEAKEDAKGLFVRARISNAPGLADLRFKLVEKHIRTMSIGGNWIYKEDGYGIIRAILHEGSIVAVPANPRAIFQTRSLGNAETKRLQQSFLTKSETARE